MFTEEFKKAAVERYYSRGSKGVKEICIELGVADPTLYGWCKKYGMSKRMENPARRPQDWPLNERLQAVFEYQRLSESDQGMFLRTKGLHSDHLVQWKKEIESSYLNSDSTAGGFTKAEKIQMGNQIKELEREMNRKEKALAEAAALLILKKKVDGLWGE